MSKRRMSSPRAPELDELLQKLQAKCISDFDIARCKKKYEHHNKSLSLIFVHEQTKS
jgi:hypothetical protein